MVEDWREYLNGICRANNYAMLRWFICTYAMLNGNLHFINIINYYGKVILNLSRKEFL